MIISCSQIPITSPRNRGLWNPLGVGPTLGLWLDAADASTITLNGSNVSAWADKSGNGNDIVNSTAGIQPTYVTNGVEFAATQYLSKSDQSNMLNSSGTHSCFMISDLVDPATSSSSFPRFFSNYSTAIGTLARRPDWYYRLSPPALLFTTSTTGGSQIPLSGALGLSLVEQIQAPLGQQSFLNGTLSATFTAPYPDTETTPAYLTVSNFNDTNNNFIFREFVFVNEEVSADTRYLIEGYLAHKWGIASLLPAAHPYKTTPPMM